jgi:signal peptidase I
MTSHPNTASAISARANSTLARAGRATAVAFTLVAVVLGGLMVVPSLLGFQRYVITGGSMTGTYDRGSIVYDRVVPTSQLRVGDVITYTPPRTATLVRHRVTHRIVSAWVDSHGVRFFRTKGDANPSPDPWRFTLPRTHQARVAFHVPYLGYVYSALGIRTVRMLVIGLPALLIAIATLMSLWRESGRDSRAAKAPRGTEGATA